MSTRVARQAVMPFGQAVMPFGRAGRAELGRWRQRVRGEEVSEKLGRKRRRPKQAVTHDVRPELRQGAAVHVTLRVRDHVPNLRVRRRFSEIRRAFAVGVQRVEGFRLVHFVVMGNHLHLLVEVDSKEALSRGMQAIGHSISRRLNAQSVLACGGGMSPLDGAYSTRRGWLGRVFAERYHTHVCKSAVEKRQVLQYLFSNAQKHFGEWMSADPVVRVRAFGRVDPYSSFALPALGGDDLDELRSPRGRQLREIVVKFWA